VKGPSHLLSNHIAVHQEREFLSGKRFSSHEKQTGGGGLNADCDYTGLVGQ